MTSDYLISVTDARGKLADLVNRVSYTGEHITLTRHGRPMAVLVPVADAERLRSDPTLATGNVASLPSSTQLGHTPSRPDADFRIAARAPAPPADARASWQQPVLADEQGAETSGRGGNQSHAVPTPVQDRDYLLIWSGGAVSVLGSQMSGIAYPLLALALTGSATAAGLIGTAVLVGQMVFRLPAGALVDRWGRRKTMLGADALRGAVLASVATTVALGVLNFSYLVIAAFVEAALGELFRPAPSAAVRRVVEPTKMATAIARFEARSYGAAVAGPPLGGLLFSLGRAFPFAADAISYACSFMSTWFVRTPMGVDPRCGSGSPTLLSQLTVGLRWIWAHGLIRSLLISAAAFNLVFTALTLAVIVAAKDHGATAAQVGIMLGISSATGLGGALLAPRLVSRSRPSRVAGAASLRAHSDDESYSHLPWGGKANERPSGGYCAPHDVLAFTPEDAQVAVAVTVEHP